MSNLLLAAHLLLPVANPDTQSVLILPLEAKQGAPRELAEVVTQLLAADASKLPEFQVVTFREVEGTMSQEQVRQVAGCSTVSCAAEIAGALNTDQIVMGTLANVGDNFVLTLSRIRARDARVVGRATDVVPRLDQNTMLRRIPHVVATLFGVVAEGQPASAPSDDGAAAGRTRGTPLAGVALLASSPVPLAFSVVLVAAAAAVTYGTVALPGVPRPAQSTPGPVAARLAFVVLSVGGAGLLLVISALAMVGGGALAAWKAAG
ncbi:MAG: hypothetical protein AB2A00_10685 [Myxococcota bacterium]